MAMETTKSNYWKQKIGTIVLTLLLVSFILFIPTKKLQWSVFIMLYVFLGAGHTFTAAIYQGVAIKHKIPSLAKKLVFILAVAIPFFVFAGINFTYGYMFGLLFIAIYFFVHHILNERTMYVHFMGEHKDSFTIAIFLAILSCALVLACVQTPSFSFIVQKTEAVITIASMTEQESGPLYSVPLLDQMVLATCLASLGVLVYLLLRKGKALHKLIFTLCALTVYGAIFFSLVPEFVYLVGFVILYHYIAWFFYYLARTKANDSSMASRSKYLRISAYLHIGLLLAWILGMFFEPFASSFIYYILFSLQFFVIWSFLHISATLANEKRIAEWFRL